MVDGGEDTRYPVTPKKPFDLLESLGRHWLKILVFGTALFLSFMPLFLVKARPYYTATGKLRVSPVVPTFIARSEESPILGYYGRYVQTQVDRLKDPGIIEKALLRLPPGLRAAFVPGGASLSRAAEILADRLEVTHKRGTHLIFLKLTGGTPEGLAEVINRLMEVFLEEVQAQEEGKDHRRLSYLKEEKKRIEKQIAAQTRLFEDVAKAVGTSSFEEAYNIHNVEFETLQKQYLKAYNLRVEAENRLKAALQETEVVWEVPLDPLIEERVSEDPVLRQIDIYSYKKIQDLEASLEGLEEGNPDRKHIEARIKEIQEKISRIKDRVSEGALRVIYGKRTSELQEKILKARSEFEAAKRTEEEIKEKLNRALEAKTRISWKIHYGKQIKGKLDHLKNLLNRIDERIYTLTLESRAPGRIVLESRAKVPDIPTGSNTKKFALLLFAMAFGGVSVLGVLYDLRDNRVRSRKDVRNALGADPTWPISDYRLTGSSEIPFSEVTLSDPLNVVSKAIHSLAARLDNERRTQNAKIFLFTGTDNECGTTEIMLNAAHVMTKLCPRGLVIEANFKDPDIKGIVRPREVKPGLVDILLGRAEPADCIFRDEKRGLDVILLGGPPTTEEIASMERARIHGTLEELKKTYDFIFLDTEPLLVSDLTEYLALKADVAALVIQGDRSLYRCLYASGRILMKLKVPAIGAVLNWGGPRWRSRIQLTVSRLIWPFQKRLVHPPGEDLERVIPLVKKKLLYDA
ncbi:MAG: hypothetical protein JRF57_13750 [Deltaproteobacteria bacterium]|nr:hypothetical protein [Deltaproteobacteria bacterium]